MKKLLLIVSILFGGLLNAQDLGMSASEVRKELESNGYSVEVIKLDDGTKCLTTFKNSVLHVYYMSKQNYCIGILFTLDITENEAISIIEETRWKYVSKNIYEHEERKLFLQYSKEFKCWTILVTYK
jgi:hypothetical protein